MPSRIQLSRRKGYRKPEGAVIVARPSKWGNPFTVVAAREWWPGPATETPEKARVFVVACFRDWLTRGERGEWWFLNGAGRHAWMTAHLPDLRGRDLACWCPLDQPCHADVLLELANLRRHTCTPGLIGSAYGCPACGIGPAALESGSPALDGFTPGATETVGPDQGASS